eukprot:scaffold7266_cov121-Skeletonema_marinoi.AAC.11
MEKSGAETKDYARGSMRVRMLSVSETNKEEIISLKKCCVDLARPLPLYSCLIEVKNYTWRWRWRTPIPLPLPLPSGVALVRLCGSGCGRGRGVWIFTMIERPR